ncbi:ABC transporter ATP-binding protein [soil metagenome]
MAMINFTQPLPKTQVENQALTDRPPMALEQPPENIVEVKDVFKIYRELQVETVALRGVDLQVRNGEFVGLVGPSGSGKSTLLNLVGGLDTPSAGQVWVAGTNMTQLPETARARLRRRRLGFVFQAHNLIPFLTALENVLLPMQLAGQAQSRALATELLTQVGLTERLHHRPDELSGGEQQRVSIACALANRPALLLADEPTGELDNQTAQTIMALLTALNQQNGVAILMVTHDLSMAAYSHRLVHMRDGAIRPEEIVHA